jgi:alpha-tubulin suppressor-like RCC1 family protein
VTLRRYALKVFLQKCALALGALAFVGVQSSCTLSRTGNEARVQISIAGKHSSKLSFLDRVTRLYLPSTIRSESEWLSLPESWDGFDCLGLHVSGPGLTTAAAGVSSRSVCSGGATSLVEPGLLGGMISTVDGGDISLTVPIGSARTVQLFGVRTRDGSCPNAEVVFSARGERKGGAKHFEGAGVNSAADGPVLLATATVDLMQDTTLSLVPEFNRAQVKPVFCDGSGSVPEGQVEIENMSISGVDIVQVLTDRATHGSLLDSDPLSMFVSGVIYLDRRLASPMLASHFVSQSFAGSSSSVTLSSLSPRDDYSYAFTAQLMSSQSASSLDDQFGLVVNGESLRDTYGRNLGVMTLGLSTAMDAYLTSVGFERSDLEGSDASSGTTSQGVPDLGGYTVSGANRYLNASSPIYALGQCGTGIQSLRIMMSDSNNPSNSAQQTLNCPSVTSGYNGYSEGSYFSLPSVIGDGGVVFTVQGLSSTGAVVAARNITMIADRLGLTANVLKKDYSAGNFRLRVAVPAPSELAEFRVQLFNQVSAEVYDSGWTAPSFATGTNQFIINQPEALSTGGTYTLSLRDAASNLTTQSGVFDLPARPSQLSAHGEGFNCYITSGGASIKCAGSDSHGQLGRGSSSPAAFPAPISGHFPSVSFGGYELKRVAGTHHTCSLRDADGNPSTTPNDRSVWCWGANSLGQLGGGTTQSASADPVQVSSMTIGTDIVDLAAGDQFSCALKASGGVFCWGRSDQGQLGNNDTTIYYESSVPQVVKGLNPSQSLTGATVITAGAEHACAGGISIPDAGGTAGSRVVCWGKNDRGQIGADPASTPFSAVPVAVGGGMTGPTELDSGSQFTCGHNTGSMYIYCWGDNNQLQLGATQATTMSSIPQTLNAGVAIEKVVTGDAFGCGLASSGAGGGVYCWGQGSSGQLGNQNTNDSSSVVSVVSLNGGATPISIAATDISAGSNHACAILQGGVAVKCWGSNEFAQLGFAGPFLRSSATAESVSLNEPTGGIIFVKLNSLRNSNIVRLNSEPPYSWGDNSHYGTLLPRQGSLALQDAAPIFPPAGQTFTQVVAGDYFVCALTAQGTVLCWGANERGQLGTDLSGNSSTPTQLLSIQSVKYLGAAAGTACAVTDGGASPGTVWCWGNNENQNLGNTGVIAPASGIPVLVQSQSNIPISHILSLDVMAQGACAVKNTGQLLCWGDVRLPSPTGYAEERIPSGVVQYGAGTPRACVVLLDGTLQCWGNNDHGGAVPSNANINLGAPTTVAGISDVRQVTQGHGHTCALTGSGATSQIFCWGQFWDGQLGGGESVRTAGSAPSAPIPGLWALGAMSISAGVYATCAAFSDGTFDCAGPSGSSPTRINVNP